MTPRLPWGPLESLVDARLYRADLALTDVNRGVLLGTNRTQIARWRRDGILPDRAEACAERLGFLPYEIYPSLLSEAIAAMTVACAAPDCPVTFVHKHRGAHRRYCCDTCRDRTNARRRYQSMPDVAAAKRQKVREYDRMVREAKARRAGRRAA